MSRKNAFAVLEPMIAEVLLPIEPVWKQLWIDSSVRRAHALMEQWKRQLAAYEPNPAKPEFVQRRLTPRRPSYVKWTGGEKPYSGYEPSKAECLAELAAGFWTVDVEAATKAGEHLFAASRAAYLAKLCEKVYEVIDETKPARLTSFLQVPHGTPEGMVHVEVDAQNSFAFDATIKTNYRYGENSANGDITQYEQYPFLITQAVIKGKPVTQPGLEAVAAAFGGWTYERVQRASQEQKAARLALKQEAVRLTYRGRKLTELRDAYNYLAKSAAYVKANGHEQEHHWFDHPITIAEAENKKAALLVELGMDAPKDSKAVNALLRENREKAKAAVTAAKQELVHA